MDSPYLLTDTSAPRLPTGEARSRSPVVERWRTQTSPVAHYWRSGNRTVAERWRTAASPRSLARSIP